WTSLIDWSSLHGFSLPSQSLLLKWRRHPPQAAGWPPFFEAEARGLALLAQTNTVRVPRVYAHGPATGARPAFIVMEWVDSAPARRDVGGLPARAADAAGAKGSAATPGALLGRQLAALHCATADAYGLDHNNFCGDTPQDNRWASSWVEFYGQRRLGFQMELAGRRGLMPRERRWRLERLIAGLARWIDEAACRPSLLHGDLWGGNWLVDAAGRPVLIDPAVYYGDREAELAMCRLFGGFPPEFYRAYDEAWPPAPGRDERIPLYQLYHLLNHLNLFGEGYGSQVDAVLQRYVG
ncbi:MAG: fructosamine kinase family protein, partial [Anaerolineae bacterium]|nr:fructosamine kinase family protein [Anaerolineae bacterium]